MKTEKYQVLDGIKTFGFVGTSGTGKSYRAQMVAGKRKVEFIIDDGLLINENKVVAGESAKKATTKVATVKHALFYEEQHSKPIKEALIKHKPKKILILGTSDGMVKKIASNLGLPELTDITYITDVATEEEIATARRIRVTEGKHVIPVPTFEIKKDFSGFLLDPLRIFRNKEKESAGHFVEKSIIRPTFSYIGNFTISDNVFKQIIEHIVNKTGSVKKITKIRVENYGGGVKFYIEVSLVYGGNIVKGIKKVKEEIRDKVEGLTSMNVEKIEIMVKTMTMPKENSK